MTHSQAIDLVLFQLRAPLSIFLLQKNEGLEAKIALLQLQLDAQHQENEHLARLTAGAVCKCIVCMFGFDLFDPSCP